MKNTGRLSQCIENSLDHLAAEEVNFYHITEKDLQIWPHCPLCQETDTTRIAEVYLKKEFLFFSTDICQSCAHIYRGISPNAAWFKARWQQIATGKLAVYNPSLEEKRKIRYELYYGILQKFKSKGLLLDIGAAYGNGASIFRERGFKVEALEPEQDRADYIQRVRGIPVHHTTIEDFEPKAASYDLILFSHCLEHLDDPLKQLGRLSNWLHDEGVLYIEIPIAWKVVDWQDGLFMAHKQNFVEKNLRKILHLKDFKIIDQYLIPDNDGPFCNLAYIAVKKTHPRYESVSFTSEHTRLFDPASFTTEDLMKLYQIQLPVQNRSKTVLKYNVPYINHFYHILRNNRHQFALDGEFISHYESSKP